jgi:hypothetical protein
VTILTGVWNGLTNFVQDWRAVLLLSVAVSVTTILAVSANVADGIFIWSGEANGVRVDFATHSSDLALFVRPVSNRVLFGIELVDADGRVFGQSYGAYRQ